MSNPAAHRETPHALHDAILANVTLPVIVYDESLRIIYANVAACLLLGAPSGGSLCEVRVFDIIHPDCIMSFAERQRTLCDSYLLDGVQMKFLRPDGRSVAASGDVLVKRIGSTRLSAIIVRSPSIEVPGAEHMVCTFAPAWLARSVLEVLPIPIIACDRERILYVNPLASVLMGAEDGTGLLDRDMGDFVHPDSRTAELQQLHLAQEQRAVLRDVRLKLVTERGAIRHARGDASPIEYLGTTAVAMTIHEAEGAGLSI